MTRELSVREAVGPASDRGRRAVPPCRVKELVAVVSSFPMTVSSSGHILIYTHRVSFQNWFHFICICEVMVI